jgi:hypothetical protein
MPMGDVNYRMMCEPNKIDYNLLREQYNWLCSLPDCDEKIGFKSRKGIK